MDKIGPPLQFSHYALLGVSKDAAADEIEAAFQSRMETLPKSRWGIMLRWVLMNETGETLRTARETLLDADLRAKYDKSIADEWYWLPTWE